MTPRIGPRQIPRELLARYATSAPRYTSYPTAPQFKSEFDAPEIAARWRSTAGRALSLYVHVPFCESRCLYCGCFTETGHGRDSAGSYVSALLAEADRVERIVGPGRPVEQLAIGGGTPVFLTPAEMTRLVSGLEERFRFADGAERSIEIDPRRIDEGRLDSLLGLRFNRMSFGVQDLDPVVQRNVARILPEEDLVRLVAHLRRRGFEALNLDLIYGLPGQTPESFARTVGRIAALRPSRIALFGYAHVPWVSPHQKALERHGIPGPEERTELFGLAYDLLADAGYAHVGMDHFALPDDELIRALESRTLTRNFMGYTTRRGLDLVGLGASSISFVGGTYTQNEKRLPLYRETAATSPWVKGLVMTPEDALRREIILDLFCNFELDFAPVERAFDVDFQEHFASELAGLAPLEADGLVVLDATGIRVTPLGRFFVRNVCTVFDQYLAGEAREARYSRTV